MCMGGGGGAPKQTQAEKDLEAYETPDYGPLPDLGTTPGYRLVKPEYREGGVAARSLLLPVRR